MYIHSACVSLTCLIQVLLARSSSPFRGRLRGDGRGATVDGQRSGLHGGQIGQPGTAALGERWHGFFFLDISGDSMGFIKLVEQCVRHPCCLVDVFLLLFVGFYLHRYFFFSELTC